MATMTSVGSAPEPIRVVLLIDSLEMQPAWIAGIVESITESRTAELVGVVRNQKADRAAVGEKRNLVQRIRNAWQKRHRIAMEAYLRFDQRRYPARGADPFAPVNIAKLLAKCPVIQAQPRQTAFSDFLDPATLVQLRDLKPDVAIRFGFRILRGEVLDIPRFGVWSFHHGDNKVNRGGPPGLWEVFLGWDTSGAVLQRLSEELDGGSTLMRTWVATNPVSVHQNRVAMYRAAAPLLLRKLNAVFRDGIDGVRPPHDEPKFLPYDQRLFVTPRIGQLASGLQRIVTQLIRRRLREILWREQWQVAYAFDASKQEDNTQPHQAYFRYKRLRPPSDRFWADPFAVHHQGRSLIFLEELEYRDNRGRIALIEVSPTGSLSPVRTVLEAAYHLSYPFILRHEGEWYMIPEMFEAGEQKVFRAETFPDRWVPHCTLDLGCRVTDVTLHRAGDTWWLFAATQATADSHFDELSIFHAESPFGPWTPHRNNPVVSDARSARPAGNLFTVGGELIRPAQCGSPAYGTSIVYKKVTRLDREGYEEVAVSEARANWSADLVGMHTVNAAGPLSVIDLRAAIRR